MKEVTFKIQVPDYVNLNNSTLSGTFFLNYGNTNTITNWMSRMGNDKTLVFDEGLRYIEVIDNDN